MCERERYRECASESESVKERQTVYVRERERYRECASESERIFK